MSDPNPVTSTEQPSHQPCENRLWNQDEIRPLIDRLAQIRRDMLQLATDAAALIDGVTPQRRASARNLMHYVSLRRNDIRELQEQLIPRGLSSLGRCEAHVHASINAVTEALCHLAGVACEPSPGEVEVTHRDGRDRLASATESLLGPRPPEGGAHIMVTMPTEAARDLDLVADLLDHGMNCMRINCVHDTQDEWLAMISLLRKAGESQQRPCKVLMDLGGPKLRTGPLEPGPAVVRWKTERDSYGQILSPARIRFHQASLPVGPALITTFNIPVEGNWLQAVEVGDEIRLTDARGRDRKVSIIEREAGAVIGICDRTAYITSGIALEHHSVREIAVHAGGKVGTIQASEQYITLYEGDTLMLGDDKLLGSPAIRDEHGMILRHASIGCSLPSVFRDLRPSERVLLDDGKIAAIAEEVCDSHSILRITRAAARGSKLRADKGINFPDTALNLEALTDKDIEDLKFVVQHADIVGYSFVRRPEDIDRLQVELAKLGRADMPIVLKIENRQAFERLPSLLLTSMKGPVSGVMIARGDLAVEIGWQRLAEVQEEILWMCESAHLPVIWATQVLETLAKTGLPSRAEITDAAMAVRAECVMLNKGPHIVEAVRVLSDILRRMQDHQVKKRPLLRKLRLADDLLSLGLSSPVAD